MKIVRLDCNIVQEIILEGATPVEKWYGEKFAALCVDAPDNVKEGQIYDPEAKTFSNPPTPKPPDPDPIKTLQAQLAHSDDAALMMFEDKAAMDDAVLTLYEKIQGGTKLYESLFNYLLAKNQSAG